MDRTVTDLLLVASVQHLRLTIEELGVGLITADRNGFIIALDQWSEALIGYTTGEVTGKELSVIFGASSELFMSAIRTNNPGYLGKIQLLVKNRPAIIAHVILSLPVGSLVETNLFQFELIFSFDA